MDDRKFLEDVKSGKITVEDGLKYLKDYNYKDMDFAKIDFQRKKRRGFGEVVFCQDKEDFALVKIFQSFNERKESVLGTRCSKHQYEAVKKYIDSVVYNPVARTLVLNFEDKKLIGNIAICTGGTADLKVAEEARVTAEFFGARVSTFYDVGVAGIHRLFSKIDEIRSANVIIAIAGMEGALPTVISGLVDKPIIAVPTSVGYGASLNGITALLTMINSCAEGISVVNIDNGFGASYQAVQINKLIEE